MPSSWVLSRGKSAWPPSQASSPRRLGLGLTNMRQDGVADAAIPGSLPGVLASDKPSGRSYRHSPGPRLRLEFGNFLERLDPQARLAMTRWSSPLRLHHPRGAVATRSLSWLALAVLPCDGLAVFRGARESPALIRAAPRRQGAVFPRLFLDGVGRLQCSSTSPILAWASATLRTLTAPPSSLLNTIGDLQGFGKILASGGAVLRLAAPWRWPRSPTPDGNPRNRLRQFRPLLEPPRLRMTSTTTAAELLCVGV